MDEWLTRIAVVSIPIVLFFVGLAIARIGDVLHEIKQQLSLICSELQPISNVRELSQIQNAISTMAETIVGIELAKVQERLRNAKATLDELAQQQPHVE